MLEYNRKNLQDAFVGDPDPLSEGMHGDDDGPEAVEFQVTSGILRAQVPADTATDQVLGPDRFYEADLVLDGGTRVSIQIAQGAEGVNILVDGKVTPGLSGIGTKDEPHQAQAAGGTPA
ncbi:MAG: hypothetical protein LC772_02255 [Chloroflexi bacterium]|nr:hypothetical protein [Chloroflexota bacterium]